MTHSQRKRNKMKKQPIDWLNPNVALSYPLAIILVFSGYIKIGIVTTIQYLKYYWRR